MIGGIVLTASSIASHSPHFSLVISAGLRFPVFKRPRFGLCLWPAVRVRMDVRLLIVESAKLGHFHKTVLGRHELLRQGSIVLSPPKFF